MAAGQTSATKAWLGINAAVGLDGSIIMSKMMKRQTIRRDWITPLLPKVRIKVKRTRRGISPVLNGWSMRMLILPT